MIKLIRYKIDTIFINSKNSKTSNPHRLLLKLVDKIDLQRVLKKVLHYQILVSTTHGKYEKVI